MGSDWYFWSTCSLVWETKAQRNRMDNLFMRFCLYLMSWSFCSSFYDYFSNAEKLLLCLNTFSWSSSKCCTNRWFSFSKMSSSSLSPTKNAPSQQLFLTTDRNPFLNWGSGWWVPWSLSHQCYFWFCDRLIRLLRANESAFPSYFWGTSLRRY